MDKLNFRQVDIEIPFRIGIDYKNVKKYIKKKNI